MIRLHAISIFTPLGIAVLLAFVEQFGLVDCESLSACVTSSGKDTQNGLIENCQLREQLADLRQKRHSKKAIKNCGILRSLSMMKTSTRPPCTHRIG